MFVDCQNFAGSWGPLFMGNLFVALHARQSIDLLNVCGDENLWVRVPHDIHEH